MSRGIDGDKAKRHRSDWKKMRLVSVEVSVLVKDGVLRAYDSWSFGWVQENRCSCVFIVIPQQQQVGANQKLHRIICVLSRRDLEKNFEIQIRSLRSVEEKA